MSDSDPKDPLAALLKSANLWRGSEHHLSAGTQHCPGFATGFAALDASLPWRGWPANALVEIITPLWGTGELQLVLPILRSISAQQRYALWISPPCMPYAPALLKAGIDIKHMIIVTPHCKDTLWSIEKALQDNACALVLAWPGALSGKHIRRLQLACVTGQTLGFIFHQRNIRHSPAVLRLSTAPNTEESLTVTILKARGSYRQERITLAVPTS